jgi:hypothetical protein
LPRAEERLPGLANELARLNVDVIVAPTSIDAEAAKKATDDVLNLPAPKL